MLTSLIILGIMALILQALVVYYGIKLYKFIGHVEYWSCAWKFYIIAQTLIFIRRLIWFFSLVAGECSREILRLFLGETALTIFVSILLLLFGRGLSKLFSKYVFKKNGE